MELDENTPLFVISVAAELSGMHPQTLRQYDRMGLVSPTRTQGRSRRYTMQDVAKLREVAKLSAEGVSLEGIRRVLELVNENVSLKSRVRDLERELADQLMSQPGNRVFAAGDQGVIRLNPGQRPEKSGSVVLWRRR
ncbi:MAG: MerR family transcriptional regulator [Actinobacteria bacterium]|jgi:MerR family transcriptional regulator/heat shock protein HspR|uniref:heat shock protein transcriptional repressor HspR n=1 Tax=Aquiluna sp. TaxID=2053504 RepID=UPI00013AC9FB|nr:MerR family transcriptional regulator [Aquiluna sp.]MDA0247394.1 MerR family transcriptional regulator [Actinomycetota bacterium]PWL21006.1 MAG: transcriptional regulator [Candidatus Aquiluna sp. XM-24bin5]MDA8549833.1 MerR family transcriptional regulator [Aquiluna sp.]MDA8551879.1 MerR family transcriptional regulator [Aquiluna sp.]